MSHAFDVAQAHRQHGLSAVQCLNLALFIDAEHQSVIRWVQVEADDVAHLLDKERIGGELKTAGTVGLHAKGLKDAMHRGTRDAARLGGLPDAPVGAVGGLARERALQQNGDLLIIDAAGPTGTQFVIESGQSMLDKTLPPLAYRSISPAQTSRDLSVALSLR